MPAAIAFAVALNLLLIARYLYPDWLAGGLVSMATWIGVLAWIFYVVHASRELPTLIAPRLASDQPDRFPDSQVAYLRGDWAEAEQLLIDVLAIEPRDPPALLLLTGVYRHTGRLDAATTLLKEISHLEMADTWLIEREAEARRIQVAVEACRPASASESDNDVNDQQDVDDQQDIDQQDHDQRNAAVLTEDSLPKAA